MKPMLAASVSEEQLSALAFPILATPKLDGIRFLKLGNLKSRTLKNIPNQYIQDLVKDLPDYIDGEIICGSFQKTTSLCMSDYKEDHFTLYVFDCFKNQSDPYTVRLDTLKMLDIKTTDKFTVINLFPIVLNSVQEILDYEIKCLSEGYEGVMLRSPDGEYKYGRATFKQQWLLKLKRFVDHEAVVVGFDELMHNDNEAQINELGRTKRQTLQENLTPANTLGSLLVKMGEIEFKIGSGFNEQQRQEIWDNKEQYLGKLVKFKTFENTGVKVKPRFPVFLGFRAEQDCSED